MKRTVLCNDNRKHRGYTCSPAPLRALQPCIHQSSCKAAQAGCKSPMAILHSSVHVYLTTKENSFMQLLSSFRHILNSRTIPPFKSYIRVASRSYDYLPPPYTFCTANNNAHSFSDLFAIRHFAISLASSLSRSLFSFVTSTYGADFCCNI